MAFRGTRSVFLSTLAFATGLTAFAAPAMAACGPLQLLNAVPLDIRSDVLFIPASINGKEKDFQFDTASAANQMSAAAAKDFGLSESGFSAGMSISGGASAVALGNGSRTLGGSAIGSKADVEIYDTKGQVFRNEALAPMFELGVMQNKAVPFRITDFPRPDTGGILSTDMFRRFDLDLDFNTGKFNTFSPEHCQGGILYWRAPGIAALPILYRDNRITVRVTLDGKDLSAIIDTGTPVTTLTLQDAKRLFDLTPDSPGVTAVAGTEPGHERYTVSFKTLSFGQVAVGNPHMQLAADLPVRGLNPNAATGSHISGGGDSSLPALQIGMDLLKLMHLYIAFNERTLYVTQGLELSEGDKAAMPTVAVLPFRP